MSDIKNWINDFDWFEYFRSIVNERKLKQNVLAEYAGISAGYLSGILTGKQKHELTRIPLILIANYLGMSLDKLMTGREYQLPILSQIKDLIRQAEDKGIEIEDHEVKEIVLLLKDNKDKNTKLIDTIHKLLKCKDQKLIDSLINIIEISMK